MRAHVRKRTRSHASGRHEWSGLVVCVLSDSVYLSVSLPKATRVTLLPHKTYRSAIQHHYITRKHTHTNVCTYVHVSEASACMHTDIGVVPLFSLAFLY